MKILITGITGMIGEHLAKLSRTKGWETFGIARDSASSRKNAIQDKNIFRCDILDEGSLEKIFKKIQPDIVAHFAAQAFNGKSWDCEHITHITNFIGTANVLRCCHKFVPEAKVLLACSSAEYGDIKPEDCPLKEDMPLKPITPYGVTKLSTEALGYQYFANYNMKIFLPRLFIHVGTGHPPATAIQNFSRQLALISKNKLEPIIYVGNLDTSRDFIDVRDGVAAMMKLLEKGNPGEPINICNREAIKISKVLEMLIEISGLNIKVVNDPSLLRLSDEPILLGDNTKLLNLGWQRKYSLKETLESVYNDWISRI